MLCTSCTKESKTTNLPLPTVMVQENVNPELIFSLSRNGQKISIQINTDFSMCKGIDIARNTTGKPKDREVVASIKPTIQKHIDLVPDTDAYYYWLKVFPPTGNSKAFGPIRIVPDLPSGEKYLSLSDTYTWTIKRTQSDATITWKFPNVKYASISIKRNTNTKTNKRNEIKKTLEWNSTHIDALPDPEADYWYWIEAILDNGTRISQGPIKAEFH